MPETFKYAITRTPAETFARGMTTANLGKPSYERVLIQHRAYVAALKSIGLAIVELEPLPDYPDAHFVEDTAVVTPDVAIITHPGAPSRRGEEKSIGETLLRYRQLEYIQAPATVDGGDVLMIANHFFIGISARTNPQGAEQLGGILEKFGNTWATIQVGAGLHLKSGVNYVGKNSILVTQAFASHNAFNGFNKIVVDPKEEYSVNTLWINDHLLMPGGFTDTKTKLISLGLPIIELDVSEMQKMDGGLTCLSIRF
jgi:dimethylargininase